MQRKDDNHLSSSDNDTIYIQLIYKHLLLLETLCCANTNCTTIPKCNYANNTNHNKTIHMTQEGNLFLVKCHNHFSSISNNGIANDVVNRRTTHSAQTTFASCTDQNFQASSTRICHHQSTPCLIG